METQDSCGCLYISTAAFIAGGGNYERYLDVPDHVNPSADVEREEALRNNDDVAWIEHPEWWNTPGLLRVGTGGSDLLNRLISFSEAIDPKEGTEPLAEGYPELRGKVLPLVRAQLKGVVLNMPIAPRYRVYVGNVFNVTFAQTLIILSRIDSIDETSELRLLIAASYDTAEELVADGWSVD